ncbi:hypothetical protein DZF91_29095 [Actinomadura logoneensis]|uniref:Esterase n=1 Tax=Actinomadura logoneensis TaxID=2293572 RepID=A0A372JDS6_9ACTN|nr:hypothetical protein [Actinomadura logoneensis]RFU38165.1 hypothetical protein DZF91_29095 [Actinomadura logoneensis]
MEPSNLSFIGLACLLAAVLGIGTLWLWPRLSGGGLKRLGARTVLLGVSQIALTLAITLLVNRWFVFYNTWDDLVGPDRSNEKVQTVQPSRGKETTLGKLVRRTPTTLGPRRPGRPADPRVDGRVDRLQITGATTGLTAEAFAYLPPQYFQPQSRGKRFPVVLAISGGPGASDDKLAWIKQARLPEQAARLTTENRAQPVVYVMMRSVKGLTQAAERPAGGGATGGGVKAPASAGSHPASCLNLPGKGTGQALSFYGQDVPLALREVYHLPSDHRGWGLLGFGGGGQCAARLAMTDSAQFGTVATINANFDLSAEVPSGLAANDLSGQGGGRPGDPFGGSAAYRQQQDLYWRLEHMPPPPISMLLTAGANGRHSGQADRFAGLARPPLRAEKTLVPVSGEALSAWRGQMPQIATWLAAHLQGE